jgi:putative hydrolase of the HAD superfamily
MPYSDTNGKLRVTIEKSTGTRRLKSYTTFLIDLDHTIFDSDTSETAAFEQTMRAAGIENSAHYSSAYREINLELWAAVERHELTPQQVRTMRFERLVATQQLAADPTRMAEDYVLALGANGELYDGAREVLEALGEQASVALVTNGLSEVQRARVHRLGIGDCFDVIAISAEIGASKPGTKIFDLCSPNLVSRPRPRPSWWATTCRPTYRAAPTTASRLVGITRMRGLPAPRRGLATKSRPYMSYSPWSGLHSW